jgi:hypothetical protein
MPRIFHHNLYREFRRKPCPTWAAGGVIIVVIADKPGERSKQ